MDYYRILGVPEQADDEQIKQAYRREAKKYHPDLNPDDPAAEARFKEIVEAYETLGDSVKRKAYDRKQEAAAGAGKACRKSRRSTPVQPVDLEGGGWPGVWRDISTLLTGQAEQRRAMARHRGKRILEAGRRKNRLI
ncbi:MAG: J domain-containing protein [Lachnospiraceae bacterium]|nr:J domain-containing protein [Lachnospiraceae bacterium]